ncbi:hypothetical protein J7F03_03785 [Streptomyces sp. ISL-43]|uniref:hypothetical protein n=1 Tax=Streptomyces sp. ISL-43 TaxID=2819183 RepID=UPI001BEC9334|nr:hypothetical protein [Streptomyces sp. ISL-43]MBT2446221.1 hypothetical protein [Streptomyces sp. ISL-43]
MGGMKDKRQEPGKGREEQQRPHGEGQDPIHPGSGEAARGKSLEEPKPRRQDEMQRERDEDETRDDKA